MIEKQEPKVLRILKYLPKIKEKTGKSASEYLGFGAGDKQPQYYPYSYGSEYYGELNDKGKPHGRGI